MLPCLFSCFASCMRSGELFYGMRVLRGSCCELAMAALERAPLTCQWGRGREEPAGLFQPEPFHDFMTLPMPDALPQQGQTPCSRLASLPRHSETSGQVLGSFWAGSGQPSFILPPPPPRPVPAGLSLGWDGGSGTPGTARSWCYLVMLGMYPSTHPAPDYPADSYT